MRQKLRWGLLATGAIAKTFASGLRASRTGELLAVGSRSPDKAETFGAEFAAPHRHGSYEALLADPEVDIVYISTPHPQHAEWAIKAARAGKHVLVEKPIGINRHEAQAMIEAATANNVFLMEAYMYRCHPQTAKLVELLREKVIGDVSVIQATFSFYTGFNPESRIWNNALAGGGILDVGGYTTSIARLIAGAARGLPFADPIAVSGAGCLHPETGVDSWAVGTLKFDGGIVAAVATGVGVAQENVVRIFGTEGQIFIPSPYVTDRTHPAPGRLTLHRRGAPQPEEIVVESAATSYTHEADACGDAVRRGLRQATCMSWADTMGNIRTQDAWRAAIGLTYESERR